MYVQRYNSDSAVANKDCFQQGESFWHAYQCPDMASPVEVSLCFVEQKAAQWGGAWQDYLLHRLKLGPPAWSWSTL